MACRSHYALQLNEIERSECRENEEHPQKEAQITYAVGDERFLTCRGFLHVGVPVADQEVRTQTHAFPSQEQDRKRGAKNQHQHRKAEQVQIREELARGRIMPHVPNRVDVNECAHTGDHQGEQRVQAVEAKRHIEFEVTDLHPVECNLFDDPTLSRHGLKLQKQHQRNDERCQNGKGSQTASHACRCTFATGTTLHGRVPQAVQCETHQGEQGNQRDHGFLTPSKAGFGRYRPFAASGTTQSPDPGPQQLRLPPRS